MAKQGATGNSRRTASGFPSDRYDEIASSGRIGAHRVTARPRYIWQYLIAGIAGFVVLTGAGIFWLQSVGTSSGGLGGQLGGSETSAPKPEAPTPVVDPDALVAVLNGTETSNLATAVDRTITAEEWGTIIFSGDAASHDVQISAVFYSDPADEDAAAGLAAQLGGLSTYTTEDYEAYGANLVVLLGSDYAGPGIDEAAEITNSTTEQPGDGVAPDEDGLP